MNIRLVILLISISIQSFANGGIPNSFDGVNQAFIKAYPTTLSSMTDRAFKGVCYFPGSQISGIEGYIAGIILGKDSDKSLYEKKIGTVYRALGNKKYTKGDVFSDLLVWWSNLSPITIETPLIVDNKNSYDIDEIRELKGSFISQSKLKVDFDCTNARPDLRPLCVNGIIPKGTHYKSCYYFEELE